MTRYYLVVNNNVSSYHKMECQYSFGASEGVKWMKEKYPNATTITHIAKNKAEQFLQLNNPSI